MKAKLRKDKDHYRLFVEDKQIGSTGTRVSSKEMYQLSFENCDEIFGVVDVEKLAEECSIDWEGEVMEHIVSIYKEGFNKAMELNKDKVFTLEDMYDAVMLGVCFEDSGIQGISTYEELKELAIKRALKPTEIEVMIEMEDILQLKKRAGGFTNMGKPKLDSEGCLILTKI